MKIAGNTSIPDYPKIVGSEANIIYPCYAETKLDGEANIYYNESLTSKASGKIRRDFPVVSIISNMLKEINEPNAMLFGELFWGEGKAGALYDFLSHQKDDNLRFCIFDAYTPALDGLCYEDRREWLIKLRQAYIHTNAYQDNLNVNTTSTIPYGHVVMTKPTYLENITELDRYVESNKAQGWEGCVVKNKDSMLFSNGQMIVNQMSWVKIKHKSTGNYLVVDIDSTLERMEIDVNGRRVGCKLVNKYKPYVKVGNIVEIEHMGVLSGGGLRHPNFKGKVVK